MNKQQEAEVKAEAPVETMEDYAAELEASYKAFDERHFELPETDDAEGEKWAEFAQMMADRTVLNVKIAEAVKGGVVAFVNEVRAFIPASQLSTEYVEKLEDWQGKHVDAVIITVDPEKKRLVLSGREVEKEKKAAQRKERLAQFKAGDVVEGTVKNVTDFGAFIDLGGADGLLHISEMSWGRVENPKKVFKVGETVKVLIKDINGDKIALSLKFPEENPWLNAADKYAVGNVVEGCVARMTDFGAFVELEPGVDALLHVSQISREHVEKPSDALKIGQEITAKVVDFNEEDKKISLSMKALENEEPVEE